MSAPKPCPLLESKSLLTICLKFYTLPSAGDFFPYLKKVKTYEGDFYVNEKFRIFPEKMR